MGLALSACSPPFHHFLPIFFAFFTHLSVDPTYFIEYSFLLAFGLWQAAPLSLNCLLILGTGFSNCGP